MSRILEFDPETMDIVWRYVGTADQPFVSSIRSTVERLPNGDTLITESNGGRLFEVTSDGRIVWEYLDPIRAGDDDAFIPIMRSEEHTSELQSLMPQLVCRLLLEKKTHSRIPQRSAEPNIET